MNNWHTVARKLKTTFVSALTVATVFSIFASIDQVVDTYVPAQDFIFMVTFFFLWVGFIILVYGNLISLLIGWLQRKFFPTQDWLYVALLGMFGSAFGCLFQSIYLIALGLFGAVLYGILDKWFLKRQVANKRSYGMVLAPLALFFFGWGFIFLIATPLPPFTAAEAVEYATSGNGTTLDDFPNEAGIWEGEIAGFQVTRETAVTEMAEGLYLVSFIEHWKNEHTDGVAEMSYMVERGSSTFYSDNGETPPYAN